MIVILEYQNEMFELNLDENMIMNEAFSHVLQKTCEYAYLVEHHYVEKLNISFLEAGVYHGERCIII